MGGSSGKPGGGYKRRGGQTGGQGKGAGTGQCQFLIHTSLASPNPQVVDVLSEGEVLLISLGLSGNTPIVEARTMSGLLAGTLAGLPHLRELIACMQQREAYQFEVVKIAGGRVDGILRNA